MSPKKNWLWGKLKLLGEAFKREGRGLGRRSWASGGLGAVFQKELADNFGSIRFVIIFSLVGIAGIAAAFSAAQSIRGAAGEGGAEFIFLRLFTVSGGSLPPFISFVSFLGPLIGLALGFDAINGEHNKGTLSRVLAQPIFRDDVINGKFLAGLAVLALAVFSLGMVVAGLGLLFTGVPPTAEESARLLCIWWSLLSTVVFG
ncbi:MAG: ABC transporter permease, partial [Desulfotomaculales bacterium]